MSLFALLLVTSLHPAPVDPASLRSAGNAGCAIAGDTDLFWRLEAQRQEHEARRREQEEEERQEERRLTERYEAERRERERLQKEDIARRQRREEAVQRQVRGE